MTTKEKDKQIAMMEQTAEEFYIDKSKFKKPKWVTDKEFNDLFDRMEIMIKPK